MPDTGLGFGLGSLVGFSRQGKGESSPALVTFATGIRWIFGVCSAINSGTAGGCPHPAASSPGRAKLREGSDGLESDLARLTRELDAARAEIEQMRQRQAATDAVLGIIAASPADPQPVFQAIVESAARLCGAEFCFFDRF